MTHLKKSVALVLLLSVLLSAAAVSAETVSGLWNALNSETGEDCTAELGVRFNMHMPFGEERREMLNALLSHVKLRFTGSEGIRQTEILIDGESVLSVRMSGEGEEQTAEYGFMPGTRIVGADAGLGLSKNAGLDIAPEFELLRGSGREALDSLYAWFQTLPELFPDNSKTSRDSQTFKNVGRSAEKTVITFTKASVEENILNPWKDACPEGVLKTWLQDVSFSGRQQITLFRNQEGTVVRISYSGQAAKGETAARKITLGWSRLRTEERDYDRITLKSPAVSGSDHDTVTAEFSETKPEEGSELKLDLSMERVADRIKRKLSCSAELVLAGETVTGEVTLSEKEGSGTQQSVILKPELKLDGDGSVSGLLSVKQKRGKDVTEDAEITLEMTRDATLTESAGAVNVIREDTLSDADKAALSAEILQSAAETLIRPLLQLPREDLGYLLYELEDSQINQLYELPDSESSERSAS